MKSLKRMLKFSALSSSLLTSSFIAGCSGCVQAGVDGGVIPNPVEGDDAGVGEFGDGGAVDGGENIDAGSNGQAPTIDILLPLLDDTFSFGESIRFSATGADAEDGDLLNANISWSSDLDGPIGIGFEVLNALTTSGPHVITCTAQDSDGNEASGSVGVVVIDNFAPVVEIQTPADDSFHLSGEPIAFVGDATDVEDGNVSAAGLTWWSNDAQIGLGTTVTTVLPDGDHVVELRAEDSQGAVSTAVVTIHVTANPPPNCDITSPSVDDGFFDGETITFSAACSDVGSTEPIANESISWLSDLDGNLGVGSSVQNALTTLGVHTISVCATDPIDSALTGCSSVSVVVSARGALETTIDGPDNNSVFEACVAVPLVCTAPAATDAATFSWTSDVDGLLGSTGVVTWVPTTSGPHVLTCTVSEDGVDDTVSVRIDIQSPTITLTSPADPTRINFGQEVDFAASACDTEDGVLPGSSLVWTSSLDGSLGIGETLTLQNLSVGIHTIVVTTQDAANNAGTQEVTIEVNGRPVVEITAPTTGDVFDEPLSIDLAGTALDPEDGPLVPQWSVPGIGPIGAGDNVTWSAPPPGVFVVRLRAQDSHGFAATASVRVQVIGNEPLLEVVAGLNGRIEDVFYDANTNTVWFATATGVYEFNPELAAGTEWTVFDDGETAQIQNEKVLAISLLPQTGGVLVASDKGFALSCAPDNEPDMDCSLVSLEPRPEEVFGLNDSKVRAIAGLPLGVVALGGDCLLVGRLVGGQLQNTETFCEGDGGGDGLVADRITDLAWDERRNVLWIATNNGVSAMSGTPPNGNITFANYAAAGAGLLSDDVNAVTVARDGNVYFGTKDGLSILRPDETFFNFNRDIGALVLDVRDVAVDVVDMGQGEREVAWLATNQGLVRLDVESTATLLLNVDDGLPEEDCRSVAVDDNHTKYVGTNAGAFIYRGY